MEQLDGLYEDEAVQLYLTEIVGSEGLKVALNPVHGEITDEKLAKKLEMDEKVVRRALFALYENGLASYTRERDEESGWYTYLWRFRYEKLEDKLKEELEELLNCLEERIEYEKQNQFYGSKIDGRRFTFEEAAELSFRSPESGSPLEPMDNSEFVKAAEKRAEKIKEELGKK